jgi:hypothetical protein
VRPSRLFAFVLLAASVLPAADFPQAKISNGLVQATLYVPDPDKGYYRATRFDWTGVIASLKYKDHEFVGKWFENYNPKIHDAILGPVEEFRSAGDTSVGYDEAKPGEPFIRLGVGAVTRSDAGPYQMFKTYNIVDAGRWSKRQAKSWIEFTHELKNVNGYAYVYKKTVRLEDGKPVMVLEHSLKNTGTKTITSQQYNHNFFVFDGKYSGPSTSVKFAFAPKATRDLKGAVAIKGNEIVYLKQLDQGESVFSEIEGFGKSPSDYDVHIEHGGAGAGVRITSDQPVTNMNFWSIRTTVCPEPYVDIVVEPGKEMTWKVIYELYLLK